MSYTYDDRIFRDLWKEAYGSRPSVDVQASWDTSTPSQKQLCWDLLVYLNPICKTIVQQIKHAT